MSKFLLNECILTFIISGSFSPKIVSKGGSDFNLSFSKQASLGGNKEKYEQKDSLYIDVGQPLFNGKTDTLNSGVNSHNNSLLLGQTPTNNPGSNPGSLSKFAAGMSGKKDNSKGMRAGGGNDLFKAAIFKNMEKNSVNSPGLDSDESPKRSYESSSFRDKSNAVISSGFGINGARKEKSPDNIEDVSNENPQVQRNVEKINVGTPDKHPSKLVSPGKRYSLLENKSGTGNSPTYSSPTYGKNSKYGEESKSPK